MKEHESVLEQSGQVIEPRQNGPCAHFPEFKRPNYFRGQMLGPREFQGEQGYLREKFRLHNRCLHGYGVVCGLEVDPVPLEEACEDTAGRTQHQIQEELERLRQMAEAEREKDPEAAKKLAAKIEELCRALEKYPPDCPPPQKRTRVRVACGFALDCAGNELLLQRPLEVDLWEHLSEAEQKSVRDHPATLYLWLCYCEQPIEPVRPIMQYLCAPTPACEYGWTWETLRVRVSTEPPQAQTPCDTCCGGCDEPCVLLAEIVGFRPGQELKPEQVHNWVRRMISTYPLTTITGIGWTHGAGYTPEEAAELLGAGNQPGLVLEFSRPVLTSTATAGVVDLWVIEGGPGRAGNIYHLAGDYTPGSLDKPLIRRLSYRQTTRETLQYYDRVLITVRAAFLLDECCRAVSGAHLGGRVPILKGFEKYQRGPAPEKCWHPPARPGPWTSGNGVEGSTFESWFYVKSPEAEGKK